MPITSFVSRLPRATQLLDDAESKYAEKFLAIRRDFQKARDTIATSLKDDNVKGLP